MPERVAKVDQHLVNQEAPGSRYRLTKMAVDETVVEGRLRFQRWKRPELSVLRLGDRALDGEDFSRHVVGPGEIGRIDLIAHKQYGDVNQWWVVAAANKIKNPLLDLRPGDSLKVSPTADVARALAGL